ncbi:hypothetical protein VTO42DRAFT_4894 [Malbranchea cinnamomea]
MVTVEDSQLQPWQQKWARSDMVTDFISHRRSNPIDASAALDECLLQLAKDYYASQRTWDVKSVCSSVVCGLLLIVSFTKRACVESLSAGEGGQLAFYLLTEWAAIFAVGLAAYNERRQDFGCLFFVLVFGVAGLVGKIGSAAFQKGSPPFGKAVDVANIIAQTCKDLAAELKLVDPAMTLIQRVRKYYGPGIKAWAAGYLLAELVKADAPSEGQPQAALGLAEEEASRQSHPTRIGPAADVLFDLMRRPLAPTLPTQKTEMTRSMRDELLDRTLAPQHSRNPSAARMPIDPEEWSATEEEHAAATTAAISQGQGQSQSLDLSPSAALRRATSPMPSDATTGQEDEVQQPRATSTAKETSAEDSQPAASGSDDEKNTDKPVQDQHEEPDIDRTQASSVRPPSFWLTLAPEHGRIASLLTQRGLGI